MYSDNTNFYYTGKENIDVLTRVEENNVMHFQEKNS